MIIRARQITALEVAVRAGVDRRMADYARRRFPQVFGSMPLSAVYRRMAEIRNRANTYEIVTEIDLATVIDLVTMYGDDFFTSDWAADVFSVGGWSGAKKVAVLRSRVRSRIPDFV